MQSLEHPAAHRSEPRVLPGAVAVAQGRGCCPELRLFKAESSRRRRGGSACSALALTAWRTPNLFKNRNIFPVIIRDIETQEHPLVAGLWID